MSYVHPAWVEHQRKRFMRHDGKRYLRADATRFEKPLHPNERKSRPAPVPESCDEVPAIDPEALARLRFLVKDLKIELALRRLRENKYSPSQPRDDRGRWTDGGAVSPPRSDIPLASRLQEDNARVVLAGGFTSQQRGMTVQSFVSSCCRGSINNVPARQFYGATIADVMAAANGGDAAARTCLKLLGRDLYRK